MLDFKSPPVDGDKPEGAPDDWSEKIQKVQGKISEMCVMELPNLQEAMNSMDKLVSVDGVYRSKYVETKEALTQEDGTLKTWPNNQPSAKARMYFVGILYAAEELFKDDFPEFIITGTKAEEMINNAVEKGLMEACRLEAAEASGYNALKEAVEETVEKAKQMKEDFEAKLQELQDAARAKLEGMKDEIKQFIQDKKTEVLGKMKTMVEEEAKKWVEENIGPKVEEGVEDWVDELGLGSTSWLPMDKLKNFAVERIMGLFAALIDQLLNGKFNPKELVADATANPLAGMTPKDMLAAGFEASKECGAYNGLHEAIEEAKEKVEEVKQEVTDAVNEVKEQVQDAVNEVKDAVDEATEGAGLGTTDEMAEKAKEELAELKAPEGKKSFFSIDTFIDRADTLPSDQYKIEKKKAQFLLFQTFLIGTAMNFLFQIGTHPGFPFGKYDPAHYM
jgi:F0F1-type ATP synthase membrane subunit b/b'